MGYVPPRHLTRVDRSATVLALMLAFLLVSGREARAQVASHSVELFSTVGAVGGVTPVSASGRTYLTPHGGGRLDGGIQSDRAAFGFGFRYWEAARTHDIGSRGGDFFALGEWRPHPDSRTTLRVTTGYSLDTVDDGDPGLQVSLGDGNGLAWSVGAGHEVAVPYASFLLLSVDVVVPPGNGNANGRRAPVLEFGVGYRTRYFQRIAVPYPPGR